MRTELSALWVNRSFRYLITARFISNVGNGMAPIALAFGVLSLPGATGTSLSFVAASQMVPVVVFLLVGGVVADRVGRARLVGGTDLLGSFFVGINGLLFITNHASVLQLCITGFIIGTLNALWYPAFSGLLPDIVPTDRLQAANSLVGFSANIGYTIGASVAGILVSSAGAGWALVVDGSTFFVAGYLVWQLRFTSGGVIGSADHPSMVKQLRAGWTEFRTRRWLMVIAGSFSLINMCFEAFLAILAPLRMKEALGGSRSMGFMMFAWGLGSMIGVVFSMRIRSRRPLVTAMMAIPVAGLWMGALAVPLHLVVIMILAVVTGVAFDIFYVMWMTTVQSNVPNDALARVGSFDALATNLLVPVGLLMAGPLAEATSTRVVLIGGALLTVALSYGSLLSTSVRGLEGRAQDQVRRPEVLDTGV